MQVILAALDLLQLTSEDVVFDIGAGEGSFIIRAAQRTTVGSAVGIEICNERVTMANNEITGIHAILSTKLSMQHRHIYYIYYLR